MARENAVGCGPALEPSSADVAGSVQDDEGPRLPRWHGRLHVRGQREFALRGPLGFCQVVDNPWARDGKSQRPRRSPSECGSDWITNISEPRPREHGRADRIIRRKFSGRQSLVSRLESVSRAAERRRAAVDCQWTSRRAVNRKALVCWPQAARELHCVAWTRRLSRAGGHGVRQEAEPAADRGRRGDPDRDPPRVCGRVCGDDGCGVQAWLPALHAHPPGSAIAPLPRRRHAGREHASLPAGHVHVPAGASRRAVRTRRVSPSGAGRGCLSRGGCDECVRSGHARVVGLVSRRRPRGARSVWAASRGSGCKGCAGVGHARARVCAVEDERPRQTRTQLR
mmetsp:Transcript_20183/g.48146  ORF Transcript_20183/g.48146 Transcript_20183/m.48146 type:complete len:340 (+) Transcript_20183:1114-2133(+)